MSRKLPDIESGTIVGQLTVIERDYDYEARREEAGRGGHHYYRCLCSCGNEVTVVKGNLIREITRSCGCLKKRSIAEVARRRTVNLSGRTFGDLMVIEQDETAPSGCGKHTYWVCECKKCGTRRSIRGNDLTGGKIIDCGCGRSKRISNAIAKDIMGMTFGHLEVLDRDFSEGFALGGGKHARWNCRCGLCGRVESVSSDILLDYGKDRCSHCSGMSNGEEKINDILENYGISFKRNRNISGCKYEKSNGSLRFDFIVRDYDNLSTYIIEFDGVQHYKKVAHWEKKIDLEGRQARDAAKNEWCKQNNIPIIRIPYTHLKDITLKDLTPSTTEFLI